ncbi:UDP-N-acetylglucosamine 2-epimerase (non-hydrolyzing) [Rhizobiaceae bacterium]|nr:UDP-N-acetylglucosamine 2-epimerase (non-hydrolyzing) [Rhizobiaceae bacterium]
MSKIFDIFTVVGARPQFVKAAAVSRAFSAYPAFSERIVHTGQHFDAAMSEAFFDELSIPEPRHNLKISGGGHGQMTGRMLEAIEALLVEQRPDAVLVYGDTNSTLAGALAASKMHIPLVHVEAGLRSFNRKMPEELNRVLTDHVSDLLFCPTELSIRNLAAEGITVNVHHVGDVMFDATLFAKEQADARSTALNQLGLETRGYAAATIHRAENTDSREALAKVADVLAAEAAKRPVVLPLHPRTQAALKRFDVAFDGVTIVEPLGYLDMQKLLSKAALVITDSGGVQKEAYFHGVPCLTLRNETEWQETVEAGWNRLWTEPDYMPRKAIAEYGEGDAAERCVAILEDHLKAARAANG